MKKTLRPILLGSALLIFYLGWMLFSVYQTTMVPGGTIPFTTQKKDNTFNVLLLGYGGDTHDGGYLTDSIMVVHINIDKKKVLIVSLPRDLWVKVPTNGNDGGHWKINAAYALGIDDHGYPKKKKEFMGEAGAGNLARYVVSTVTGITIDKFIAIDFDGFKNTIDALGGVDITVERTFDDPEYPIDGKEKDLCGKKEEDLPELEKIATQSAPTAFPCRYETLHFDQGPQHMNGETALKYVRSRHSPQDGTDFGRTKRQQNLLMAVKEKVLSVSFIPKIIPFVSSLENDFKTDMTVMDITTLLNQAKNTSEYGIKNIAITDNNFLKDSFSQNGQNILIPKEGIDNWSTIHNWIRSQVDDSTLLKYPIVQIENATNINGLADVAGKKLQGKGILLLPPTTATATISASMVRIKKNTDRTIVDVLKQEFGVTPTVDNSIDAKPYDILIKVGQDYVLKQRAITPSVTQQR